MTTSDLNKLFVHVPAEKTSDFVNADGSLKEKATNATYLHKIIFLAGRNEIITHGVRYGLNNASDVSANNTSISTNTANINTLDGKITDILAELGTKAVPAVNYTQEEIDEAKAIVEADGYVSGSNPDAEAVATKTTADVKEPAKEATGIYQEIASGTGSSDPVTFEIWEEYGA